ncbi:hypothetical protein ONZ45_g12966 [Pleurotus djamor]|nr:hypothetical protein ONZ45_g12966 [Pleurotus djamor]
MSEHRPHGQCFSLLYRPLIYYNIDNTNFYQASALQLASQTSGHLEQDNLARLNLPFPEAVFEIKFFRRNPVPFYALAKELYPGKFRPTITHSFIKLLASKNLLHTCFTQNIDTLERRAGVPDNKIIEAHGSFAKQRCIKCKRRYDDVLMKKHVEHGKVPTCNTCGGYVKPDIVFFGESLPNEFLQAIPTVGEADLLVVMGTSLTVHPFASLVEYVDDSCPRVLINLDRVGDFGDRADDVVLLGKCDDVILELAEALGWRDELETLWAATADSVKSTNSVVEPKRESGSDEKEKKANTRDVDVGKLTEEIGKKLSLDDKQPNEETKGDSRGTAEPSSSSREEAQDDEAKEIIPKQDGMKTPTTNSSPRPQRRPLATEQKVEVTVTAPGIPNSPASGDSDSKP